MNDGPRDHPDRDEHLAALLAVEPLDELTRRRLVQVAVEASESHRPTVARWRAAVGVAAALAVGAVVGTVLVNHPDDTMPTAAPKATAESTSSPLGGGGADALVPAAGEATTALGDLGDVTDPDALREAIGSARALATSGGSEEIASIPCTGVPAEALGLVAAGALATATFTGEPAVVFVGTSPDGTALAVVARAADCAVVTSVAL
jgi:hypothetical protein